MGISRGSGGGVDAGDIKYMLVNKVPAGWLRANGAIVSRSAFARLFRAIGTQYGAGDGITTFQLPDLRGQFIRCWDDGRGVDSGRGIGTWQASQNLVHAHGASNHTNGVGIGYERNGTNNKGNQRSNLIKADALFVGSTVYWNDIQTSEAGIQIYNDGGSEARPPNVALLALIKY